MQFKLHLLQPIRNIRIIHPLHKHLPAMRMVGRHALRLWILDWIEWSGRCAEDEGAEDLHAFYAFLSTARRRHGIFCFVVLMVEDDQDGRAGCEPRGGYGWYRMNSFPSAG